jgi:hypothetical protein
LSTATSRAKKLDARFKREMTETVEGMRATSLMDEEAHKLTMRDLELAPPAGRSADGSGNPGDA